MRLPILLSLLTLSACASPLPPPDPHQAWISMQIRAGYTLMADRLDGQRWGDGRYFEVRPGPHELDVRFQFEVPGGGGGGNEFSSEPVQMTCQLRLSYADFAAGQRYQIAARPLQRKAQGWLYDANGQVLAKAKVLRCNTFG